MNKLLSLGLLSLALLAGNFNNSINAKFSFFGGGSTPKGEYKKTCKSCAAAGGMLVCDCKTNSGKYREDTSLRLDKNNTSGIINDNGNLRYKN